MKKFFGKIKAVFSNMFKTSKRCFVAAFEKATGPFSSLNTLVAMQFKDKLSFSFKADKKGAIIKLVLYFVLIIGLTAILTLIFSLLGKTMVFGSTYFPIYLFNFFFILMFLISVITCLVSFTNSLYFSPDNQVLLTYPVKANTVFISKVVVFYLFELVKNFGYLFPLFFAFGLANSFKIGFYFWMPFCLLFISMLPVAIAAFLSIAVMKIKMLLRKAPVAENIIFTIILIAGAITLFYFVSLLPKELRIAQEWSVVYWPNIKSGLFMIEKIFMPIEFLSRLVMGYADSNQPSISATVMNNYTAPIFFGMIGVILVLFALAMLIVRPLFFKTASKPFEYKRTQLKPYFVVEKDNIENYIFAVDNVPIDESYKAKKIRQKDLEKILKTIKSEEGTLIKNNKIMSSRILKKLNGSNQTYHFVEVEKGQEIPDLAFAVVRINNVCRVALIIRSGWKRCLCYDPNYLYKKNSVKNPTVSTLVKDTTIDVRTTSAIFNNCAIILLPALLVFLLNKILCALRLNTNGMIMTITFSIMIILLILLASNVSAASIYSKEGQSSYLLKAAPVNYIKSLSTKLIVRFLIGVISIIAACVALYFSTTIVSFNYWLLSFTLLFIFAGHMLWSAELDYMNPQDNLYNTSGETRSVTSPNESLSGLFGLLTVLIFSAIIFFFGQQSISDLFVKIFLIALLYFVARLILFMTKIIAYKTSRSENR